MKGGVPPPLAQDAAVGREEPTGAGRSGVTVRAVVLGLILSLLSGLWIRQAEIIVLATQITESVPVIPALAALLLLVALNPLLKSAGARFGLTRQEILVVYVFVTVAVGLSACSVIRFLINILGTPFYLGSASGHWDAAWHLLPRWLVVSDPETIRRMYERDPTGDMPWAAWAVPIAAWSGFILTFWFCLLCLAALVRRRWSEAEHLAFPLIALPLDLTREGARPLLRSRLLWAGFGLSAAYNLVNIAHVLAPAVPFLDKRLDLSPSLASPPWSSLQPVVLEYRPELIGFGYLVPLDISFSIWFFWLLGKVEAFALATHGLDVAGLPFAQEQGMGAFLLLGVWLVWRSRSEITRPFLRFGKPGAAQDPDAPVWPVAGLLLSFLFLSAFLAVAGMALWVAVVYLLILLLTALTSARIRAEAGVPLIWLFPFGQQQQILFNVLGTGPLTPTAAPATLAVLYLTLWMARGFYPAYIGTQIESLKMADMTGIPRGRMVAVLLGAAVVGLGLAWAIHLPTYYARGAIHLGGGMWGTWMTPDQFGRVVSAAHTRTAPDPNRTHAYAAGALLTLALLLVRTRLPGFPLHPLGFAAANCYGALTWWPFLVVWILKALVLRYGGSGLYRRTVPFFLGFALGHLVVAGVFWGLVGAFWPEAAKTYNVFFG